MHRQALTTADKWTRYWSDGRIAACMADDSGTYGDLLGQQWRQWIGRLPAAARVLDLATGNGALIHLALSSRQGDSLHLTGVDYASIQPWLKLPAAAQPRVRFYGQTNIEQLPFAANMFDAVISQYGAEYAATLPALTEAVRVLAPGGQLRWVCHHQRSKVYRNTCNEIGHARFVLEQAQPDVLLQALLRTQIDGDRFIEQSHQRTAATPQRQALDAALQACMQRLRESAGKSDFLDMVMQNLGYLYQHRESHAPDLVLQKVAEVRVEMEVYLGRMQALVDSALDDHEVANMTAIMQGLGMQHCHTEMVSKHSGDIIGVAVSAARPE